MPDTMHQLHVADVMDVNASIEADNHARAVKSHRKDRRRVFIVADFSALFKMAYLRGMIEMLVIEGKISEEIVHTFNLVGSAVVTTATKLLLNSRSAILVSSLWLQNSSSTRSTADKAKSR